MYFVVFRACCLERKERYIVISNRSAVRDKEEKYFPTGRCRFQFPKLNLVLNKESGLQS